MEPRDKGRLGRLSDPAGRNRVKPEQASKVSMWMPTRHGDGEGRTGREVIDRCTVSIHRGIGNGTSEGRDEGRQERPVPGGARAPTSSSGRRLGRESDRGVGASRPGNAGGAKAPDFRHACEAGKGRGDWRQPISTDYDQEPAEQALRKGEGGAYQAMPWACREVCRKAGCGKSARPV